MPHSIYKIINSEAQISWTVAGSLAITIHIIESS
jgi:hypothetical protein